MTDTFLIADNIVTSLGFTTDENVANIIKQKIGVTLHDDKKYSQTPVHLSLIDSSKLSEQADKLSLLEKYTRLEQLFIYSISEVLKQCNVDLKNKRTLLILSTTKGNIDIHNPKIAAKFGHNRIYLWSIANILKKYFDAANDPVIVSNACISGSLAIIIGKQFIESGLYDNIVVSGGDILTEFVISGFQSFQAISTAPCKPFDAERTGISLGEACGTVVLSNNVSLSKTSEKIRVSGGASSNDANHISGPSRDGEGLYIAISKAISQASKKGLKKINYISAHGTATDYNDEMEAKALAWANLEGIPTNSYKGYFGHTLGAAGIIESILSIQSLMKNTLFVSAGYNKHGVSKNIKIISELQELPLNACLKTASGFGGCNAAVVYEKR